jgi:hypothetical protein
MVGMIVVWYMWTEQEERNNGTPRTLRLQSFDAALKNKVNNERLVHIIKEYEAK